MTIRLPGSLKTWTGLREPSINIYNQRAWHIEETLRGLVWLGQRQIRPLPTSNYGGFVKGMVDDYQDIFGKPPQSAPTPGFPRTVLMKNQGDTLLHKEYRSMVGKLLYFVKKVGPVCLNACRELSQHLANPEDDHRKALQQLLGYISSNLQHQRLHLRPPSMLQVQNVVDNSFGDNPDTRKSTSAYIKTISGSW
jgi:hypothetical protein